MKKLISLIAVLTLVCTCCAAFAEGKTVNPVPAPIDPENGTFVCAAAFAPESLKKLDDGSIVLENVKLFTEDKYNEADILALAEGDELFVDGATITVKTVVMDECGAEINGGLGESADGATLAKDEDGSFRFFGMDDVGAFTQQAEVTLVLDKDVAYTDASDLEADAPVVANGDEALMALFEAGEEDFITYNCYNTTVTVKDGVITAIERVYMP